MELLKGLTDALYLVITLDPKLMEIIFLSLKVSGTSVFLAGLIGIPLGTYLGLRPKRKVQWLIKIVYTFMGLPPVVAGLVIYLLLSSQGPLGVMDLLFTPGAMIVVQTLLATPIVAGLSMVGIRDKNSEIKDTAVSLGANKFQLALTIIREARYTLFGAIVAGFGRIVAEVGAVMMVGGNIEGYTRVMTTSIVLETRRGNFETAIGLGVVLMIIAFIVNSLLYRLQGGVSKD